MLNLWLNQSQRVNSLQLMILSTLPTTSRSLSLTQALIKLRNRRKPLMLAISLRLTINSWPSWMTRIMTLWLQSNLSRVKSIFWSATSSQSFHLTSLSASCNLQSQEEILALRNCWMRSPPTTRCSMTNTTSHRKPWSVLLWTRDSLISPSTTVILRLSPTS